jgi:hypothetical protein
MKASVTPALAMAALRLAMSVCRGSRVLISTGPIQAARRKAWAPVMRDIFSRSSG